MPIIIAVHDHRIGVIQQRAPAKHGDIDLALQRRGQTGGKPVHSNTIAPMFGCWRKNRVATARNSASALA